MKKVIKIFLKGVLHLLTNNRKFKYFLFRNLNYSSDIADLIIKNNKEIFIDICDKYPSSINDGYRHIVRVNYLVKCLQLPFDVIVDIGAADGDISLLFTKAYPSSTIYAFEPIEATFLKLIENVKGYSNIKPINKALGNTHEKKIINITENIGSSSIYNIKNDINNTFIAGQLKQTSKEEIIISKLDDELPKDIKISIIKIDVQGYELEVLKGAEQTLSRTKILILEMQNHDNYINSSKYFDLDEFLRKRGFKLIDVIPSLRIENILYEWDGIYLNLNN